MPYGSMSDETSLILKGQGLDAWAICPREDEQDVPEANVSIIWDGALDEEFSVREEYARECVDHIADAMAGNSEAVANGVVVMATPVRDGEATGDLAYTRRVGERS